MGVHCLAVRVLFYFLSAFGGTYCFQIRPVRQAFALCGDSNLLQWEVYIESCHELGGYEFKFSGTCCQGKIIYTDQKGK